MGQSNLAYVKAKIFNKVKQPQLSRKTSETFICFAIGDAITSLTWRINHYCLLYEQFMSGRYTRHRTHKGNSENLPEGL